MREALARYAWLVPDPGTGSGLGTRWRPLSTALTSAPGFGVATCSSVGFGSCGLAPMATGSCPSSAGGGGVAVRQVSCAGTESGPGPRWRHLGPTKGCAARLGTCTGSSAGFERRGSARMATSSGPRGPTSGAGARGGQQRRGGRCRYWTSLAAPWSDQRLRGSLENSVWQLCGLRTRRIGPDGD